MNDDFCVFVFITSVSKRYACKKSITQFGGQSNGFPPISFTSPPKYSSDLLGTFETIVRKIIKDNLSWRVIMLEPYITMFENCWPNDVDNLVHFWTVNNEEGQINWASIALTTGKSTQTIIQLLIHFSV